MKLGTALLLTIGKAQQINQCSSEKEIDLRMSHDFLSDWFRITAEVKFPQQYFAQSTFLVTYGLQNLQKLIQYIASKEENLDSLTQQDFDDLIDQFEQQYIFQNDFIEVQVDYVNDDELLAEFGERQISAEYSNYDWSVNVANPYETEFSDMPELLIDAIFTRQPGPYILEIKDVVRYEFDEVQNQFINPEPLELGIEAFEAEDLTLYESFGGRLDDKHGPLEMYLRAPVSYACDQDGDKVTILKLLPQHDTFYSCEQTVVRIDFSEEDYIPNFDVEQSYFELFSIELHTVDDQWQPVSKIMDASILADITKEISISDEDYTLTIGSLATKDFDEPFQVSISLSGLDTAGYLYMAHTIRFLFRPEEATRAYLEPYRQHFDIYHSAPFWFFPSVEKVGSCDSESKMTDYDWDKNDDLRMYCELYELDDLETIIASSQYASCLFQPSYLKPNTEYMMEVSFNFDSDNIIDQESKLYFATQDVEAICAIEGTQVYSRKSGKSMNYKILLQNVEDDQVSDYVITWECNDQNGSDIEINSCLDINEDDHLSASVKILDSYKQDDKIYIGVTLAYQGERDSDLLPNCWTSLLFVEEGIQVLETDFFLIGASNDYTTSQVADITPFDHIFIYCQHEVPNQEGITIDYDWYELEDGRDGFTDTYKSHKSYSKETLEQWYDETIWGVRCEVRGIDENEDVQYMGVTEKYLHYNDFDKDELEYSISPETGLSWETDFSVQIVSPDNLPFECDFYYEYDSIRYEMIPQGMLPSTYRSKKEHRSYTSIPLLISGIRLPADLSFIDERLRTFANCYIHGLGQRVLKIDLDVLPRETGVDQQMDRQIVESVLETEVAGDFEEVTHFYLRVRDNYEVFDTRQKVDSLVKLLNALGLVPRNDADFLDLTKQMEISNIAIYCTMEYFNLKSQMTEQQQEILVKTLRGNLMRIQKYIPVNYGSGQRYLPVDIDKGQDLMDNMEIIMDEGNYDDRDEIISSFDQLLVSMYVALDATEFEFDSYERDMFSSQIVKVKPEDIERLAQSQTFEFIEPKSRKTVSISYAPSDIYDSCESCRSSESLIIMHKVFWQGHSSLLSPTVTVSVYRQPTQNLDQARHYIDKPSDLTLPLTIDMEYTKPDSDDFPSDEYSWGCVSRENVEDNWLDLAASKTCDSGKVSDSLFKCCTDHLTDFAVQIVQIYTKRSQTEKQDAFRGRLVIGPIFLVFLDLFIVAGLVLILVVWKNKQSLQLEETGLYPFEEQKQQIKKEKKDKKDKKGKQEDKNAKKQQKKNNKGKESKEEFEGGEEEDGQKEVDKNEAAKKEDAQQVYGEEYGSEEGEEEEFEEEDPEIEYSPPKTGNVQKMGSNVMNKERRAEKQEAIDMDSLPDNEAVRSKREREPLSNQKQVRAAEEDGEDFNNLQNLVQDSQHDEEEKYDIVASSPEGRNTGSNLKNSLNLSDSKNNSAISGKNAATNENSIEKGEGPSKFMKVNEETDAPALSLSPQKRNPLVGNTGAVKNANESRPQSFQAGDPLTTKEMFILSQKCFNRFICGFFERKKTYNKLGLFMICLSQYYLLMLLCMMCWFTELFIIVFLLMRVLQLILQFILPPLKGDEPHYLPKARTFSMIGLSIGLVIIILTHVIVAIVDDSMASDESMGSWGELYVVCFFLELLWDVTLVHLISISMVKKGLKPEGYKTRIKLPEMFFKGVPLVMPKEEPAQAKKGGKKEKSDQVPNQGPSQYRPGQGKAPQQKN